MMNIEELEQYIQNNLFTHYKKFKLTGIFFENDEQYNKDGVYISLCNDKYNIIYVERGKEKKRITTKEENVVLWYVLDSLVFYIAVEFAVKNSEKGRDFRRKYFEKELEIFAEFGKDFELKKKEEICKILEKNPYNDTMN